VDVLVAQDLDAAQLDDLRDLLARSARVDGHPALPEPQLGAVQHGTLQKSRLRVLLAYEHDALVGAAFLSPANDGSYALHPVIDPVHRAEHAGEAIRSSLIERALGEPGGTSELLRLWAMRATDADDAAAARYGFTTERELIQMKVLLPLPAEVVASARPVTTRPFEPGRDDAAWLEINNRAFAGHPEQGNWTAEELQERLGSDWVDLDGFLVAEAPDGTGLIGSCWTKVHTDSTPTLGEIYVISVDPDRHGEGWGKALTVAGLIWLAQAGITDGMLYTSATNTAAVALYRGLGFTVDHVDRAYQRGRASA
jgi:mycothiol synthase